MHKKRLAAAVLLAASGIALVYKAAAQKTPAGREVATSTAQAVTLPPVAAADLPGAFDGKMKPFLDAYCIDCHAGDSAAADLSLDVKNFAGMGAKSEKVLKMVAKLTRGQMPPADAASQPSSADRAAAIAWLKGFAAEQIRQHAGDPGTVLAHRLSNQEYNYTIKDLTGQDIQPAKEFPVDPANQAGFDNSGESLMSDPAMVKKYLDAAHDVAEHVVFQTDGLAFAPDPAVVETNRDKYAVDRVIDFYKRQPTDLAAYLVAAWHYEQKKPSGATFESIAAQEKVSPKYLKIVHGALTDANEKYGPIAGLAAWWRTLKDAANLDDEKKTAGYMATWVHALRAITRPTFPNLNVPGMDGGSQPLVIWKVRQIEATRYDYLAGSALKMPAEYYIADTAGRDAMKLPEGDTADYEAAFKRFAAIFPDEYLVTERAPANVNPNSGEGKLKGHLLNAGLHNQTGFFRDDRPLCDLILNEKDKAELDRLWNDLELVTDAPLRQFQAMIWFERTDSKYMVNADFNFVRAEDTDLDQEPKFSHLREVFLKDLPSRASPQARTAIQEYFDYMEKLLKDNVARRKASEGVQLQSLVAFAEKAYRRPMTDAEKADLLAFYHQLRTDDDLDHQEAVRDVLTSVLMSPYFCFRYVSPPAGTAPAPLNDYELASRLSYFLWSSMPDDELMQHAAKGDLHQPAVLLAQAHRMLADARAVNFATEFGGNWLGFRQFETYNGVDRERFPNFTNDLREAMYQEPIHFLTNMFQTPTSVLDALYGDYTFVDAALAKDYGMNVTVPADAWVRVDNAHTYQRGGILPMGVFLTMNAPGLRTSPVKRGNWVVRRVLGEEIPAPPPNVPALPPDESKMELSLPQTLARHRADPNCATCHVRFDSLGLAFEEFGPVGDARKVDLAGKPIEDTATFPSGQTGTGLEGLRSYIKTSRESDYLDNLCREVAAYALGRTLMLSDEALIAGMRANLARNDDHFSALIDTVVTSPQFLNKKNAAEKAKSPSTKG